MRILNTFLPGLKDEKINHIEDAKELISTLVNPKLLLRVCESHIGRDLLKSRITYLTSDNI